MDERLIDALAVARLARLVNTDRVGRPIRQAMIGWSYGWLPPSKSRGLDLPVLSWPSFEQDKGDEPPLLADMSTCRWCLGFWCGVLALAGRRFAPRLWDPFARALAWSWVAGMSGEVELVAKRYIEG